MKAAQAILLPLGIAAALATTGCKPENEEENTEAPSEQSTGVPKELQEEVAALDEHMRAMGDKKDADTFATQGTGISAELPKPAEEFDKRIRADALSEAGLRVKGLTDGACVPATQSTGIPDEASEQADAITKRLEGIGFVSGLFHSSS